MRPIPRVGVPRAGVPRKRGHSSQRHAGTDLSAAEESHAVRPRELAQMGHGIRAQRPARGRAPDGLDFVVRHPRPAPPALRHAGGGNRLRRSEEHTSELQSLMRISYAVFCLKKKTQKPKERTTSITT